MVCKPLTLLKGKLNSAWCERMA